MKRLIICALILISFSSCNRQSESKEDTQTVDTSKSVEESINNLSQQDSITATGREVLALIKAQNYQDLVKYFANDGVLFSPYAYIAIGSSKKLSPDAFLDAISTNKTFIWGSFDGTGDPIKLTVKAYISKFVYSADFLNAEAVGLNQIIKQGNSTNNLKAIYPNHSFIDYHFSGFDQKLNGMDWVSLRLVFEKQNGQYFIVAIIHDQWTT